MTVWPKLSAMAQAVSEAPSMEEAGLPQATMTASDSYFQVSVSVRNVQPTFLTDLTASLVFIFTFRLEASIKSTCRTLAAWSLLG